MTWIPGCDIHGAPFTVTCDGCGKAICLNCVAATLGSAAEREKQKHACTSCCGYKAVEAVLAAFDTNKGAPPARAPLPDVEPASVEPEPAHVPETTPGEEPAP